MKNLVILGALVGSSIGGYIPIIWGGSLFSYSSVLLGGVGGLLGIWIAFEIGKQL